MESICFKNIAFSVINVGFLFGYIVEDNKAKKYLNNSFSKVVSSSFISSNFIYDLDLKNMISRKISNNLLSASKKGKVPMLKLNEIEKFANNINILNEKKD